MPQRTKPDALKLVNGKLPPPKRTAIQILEERGMLKTEKRERDKDAPVSRKKQSMPRAPKHFSDDEKRAWRDVCRPICERSLWKPHLTLWAEGFAVLLAVSRLPDTKQKVNRSILRLYQKDQAAIIDLAPAPPERNPFADL